MGWEAHAGTSRAMWITSSWFIRFIAHTRAHARGYTPCMRSRAVVLVWVGVVTACGSGGSSSSTDSSGSSGDVVEETADVPGPCDAVEGTPCYTGPVATQDIGECRAGVQLCEYDGSFDVCEGEVGPIDERCDTPGDDDCDGEVNEGCVCVPGEVVDCYDGPEGTVGVGACIAGTQSCVDGLELSMCYGQLTPQPEDCISAADDDCDGSFGEACPTDWAIRFGGENPQIGHRVAVDSMGEISVVGVFHTEGEFGGATHSTVGFGGFLTKFDASGVHLWSAGFAEDDSGLYDVSVDPNRNVIVAGRARGPVDFGGGVLEAVSQSCQSPFAGNSCRDVILGKFTAAGGYVFGLRFRHAYDQGVVQVAVDATGHILVGGHSEDIDLGGGQLSTGQDDDAYVGRFDPAGNLLWSRGFATATRDSLGSLGADTAGNPTFLLSSESSFDLGDGPIANAGGNDFILVKLDAATGEPILVRPFGGPGDDHASIISTSTDEILLAGRSSGDLDLGGGSLAAVGSNDLLLARYDANGDHQLSRRIPGAVRTIKLAPDGADGLYLTLRFAGELDVGAAYSYYAEFFEPALLVHFDATLEHLYSQKFGDSSSEVSFTDIQRLDESVVVIASPTGQADLGTGVLEPMGGNDVVLARLSP